MDVGLLARRQVKQPKQVQGSVTRQFEPVDGPSAWVAADYRNRTDAWTYHLSDADIAELDTAVANVQHSGVEIQVSGKRLANNVAKFVGDFAGR